jgi:predicted lipid-binding transport protein (Tim44 family)
MILLGCLLAFSIALAPRVILVLAWLFSDRWPLVWQGEWILPLLGILFLPYTTIMYLLTWTLTGGIEGWDWMWILLGLFLDFMKWSQVIANRKHAAAQTQKMYSSSGGSAAAAVVATPSAVAEPVSAPAAAPAAPAPAAPAPEPDPTPEPAAPAASSVDPAKLAELDQLKASGALTDAEYEAAKAKLEG